jgi:parvulin-like peptidyl-prolyl isomerase
MAKTENKAAPANRKRMVGLQREQYYNRILLIATIAILVLVLGLVGWGQLYESVILPQRVVARVEETEITGEQFRLRAQLNRQTLVSTYLQYVDTYQFFASDPNLSQQLLNQMYSIQNQLDPLYVGQLTLNQMVDDEIMRYEAAELGIEISDEVLDRAMQEQFGFFADGTPTPTSTLAPAPTSTLSATQYAIVSATPTTTSTSTPDPDATATSSATAAAELTPTEAAAATSTPLASPTPFPTATPFTQAGFEELFANYIESQTETLGLTEADLREVVYASLLRERFREKVAAEVDRVQEQVWARHILVEEQATALQVLQDLEDGVDWSVAALTYSLDSSNSDRGGDLGWFPRNAMVEEFANAAFELEVGEISEPVESQFGYHIIQVLGHEDRPLDAEAYNNLVAFEFEDYLNSLRETYDYEVFNNWQDIAPEEPAIPAQYRLQQN